MSARPSVDTERTKVVTPQVSRAHLGAGSRMGSSRSRNNVDTSTYDDSDSIYDSRVMNTLEHLQHSDTLPVGSADTLDVEERRQFEQRRFDYLSRHMNPTFIHDQSDIDISEDKDRDLEKDDMKSEKARVQEQPQGPPQGPEDPNLVGWDGPNDPENPMNWPRSKKWLVTSFFSFMTFVITFSSSVFSTATVVTSTEFGVSQEVTTLGTSLFVLGFAVGPTFWGPLSELYGRLVPLFGGYFVFMIFQIPVATAQNLQTIMVTRFFGGVFGCAPLAVVGGALADFWDPVDRGIAVATFAAATFVGPVAGPVMGGFITQSSLGWRWTAWITMIMAALFLVLGLFFIRESCPPVLLQRRAKKRRYETRNWALHARADEDQVNFQQLMSKYLLRPMTMLVLEPILNLVTIYMALIYGILYLFFEAYPISFQEQRGWNDGVGALPFLGITVGVFVGVIIIVYLTKTRYARKMKKHGKAVPEERLVAMMIGAVMLPVGLFWFAWTSDPHITWVPQVLAGIPIGAGVFLIFMQGLSYIIDVYLMYANSAIAANTLVRSLAGAGFPLFATPMFNNLGVAWATSLLGFLTLAMVPVPVLFFIYGKKIRSLSKFSPTEKRPPM
ncbi:hypothetical protein MMC08_003374 [Hypocenomyce scalaris]|nr:hypothetical protein [Hypocenomyce scalaris]